MTVFWRMIYLFNMYNKAFLIGNLTRDPEVRFTPAGIPVAKFALAINRPVKKGSEKGEVDYINIVAWRRLAEIVRDYLKKGMPVSIEGKLQIRPYKKNGEKKIFAEVVADSMQMLGRRSDSAQAKTPAADVEEIKSDEEEAPF